MNSYDVIIRGGTVVDGLGGKPYRADLALQGSIIKKIGTIDGECREEVDASGCIVTPGFVDIHTHFDGQATWASRMAPATAVSGSRPAGKATGKN